MSIPTISPYPMPAGHDLPENTAPWTVDPRRAVLLVHDMQKYFLAPFPPGESPVRELVGNVRLLRERCAELDVPVAYTAMAGGMTDGERGLLKDFWGPGMDSTPEHTQFVDELRPGERDRVFGKCRYSALYGTGLADFLRERGRDQLIVCGVYAHVGCLVTACDAFMHDIQPFMVGDAVGDFSHGHHHLALTYAASRCAVAVDTRSVLAQLGGPRESVPYNPT